MRDEADRYTTWANADGTEVTTQSAFFETCQGDDPDDPAKPLLSWYGDSSSIEHMRMMHEWASEQVEEILK